MSKKERIKEWKEGGEKKEGRRKRWSNGRVGNTFRTALPKEAALS